jgi:protein TonB
VAAGGVCRGTSDVDTNYRGRVAAHIARHKRFPPDARTRGYQGNATVTFALDERGRVTAATLVNGTGIASLDREATAMIERASPFPAPPGGRAVSFTVPVSFKIK